ncbi:MAG TPA: glycosyltransferase family 61 protein [Nevskiaceae bacterium]|nr:glycosyltransferase family 61 protein [Nevskiaceae bacterium]
MVPPRSERLRQLRQEIRALRAASGLSPAERVAQRERRVALRQEIARLEAADADPAAAPVLAPAPEPLRAPPALRHAVTTARTIERQFEVLDLRSADSERADPEVQAVVERFLRRYQQPLPLTADQPRIAHEALVLAGGLVWERGEPLLGTFPPSAVSRRRPAIDRRYQEAIDDPATPRLPGLSVVIERSTARNYFHWMTEQLPRFHRLRAVEAETAIDRILVLGSAWEELSFVRESVATFFPQYLDRIHPLHTAARCEHALYFDQPRDERKSRLCSSIDHWLEALVGPCSADGPPPGRLLYVSRRDARTRLLLDESAWCEQLATLGFEVVTLAGLPVTAQQQLFSSARCVISAHGANLTNIMFCRPGTQVVELMTAQFIDRASYLNLSMMRGLPYTLALVDQDGPHQWLTENTGNSLRLGEQGRQRLIHHLRSRLA